MGKHPAALSFTGGKDCMLALAEVLAAADPEYRAVEVKLLVTFGPASAFEEDEEDEEEEEEEEEEEDDDDDDEDEDEDEEEEEEGGFAENGQDPVGSARARREKKGFKAHPLPVIRAQARALGLPHVPVPIDGSGEGGYQGAYQAALRALMAGPYGITHLVTGDILDVCNGFMDKAAAGAGCALVRPLWQKPRKALLAKMAPFTFLLSCCSVEKMGSARAREYVGLTGPAAYGRLSELAARNERLQEEEGTKPEIDACGEQGEFHSMVLDAPFFRHGRLAFAATADGTSGSNSGKGGDGDDGKPPILETEDGKFLYCDLGRLEFVPKEV